MNLQLIDSYLFTIIMIALVFFGDAKVKEL